MGEFFGEYEWRREQVGKVLECTGSDVSSVDSASDGNSKVAILNPEPSTLFFTSIQRTVVSQRFVR